MNSSRISQFNAEQKSDTSINIDKIGYYLEKKQTEFNELQEFLVKEFEEIERYKENKLSVVGLLRNQVTVLFRDLKEFIKDIVREYQNIFQNVRKEFGLELNRYSLEVERKIMAKDQQKRNLQKYIDMREPNHSKFELTSYQERESLSRSRKQTGISCSKSSTFLEYRPSESRSPNRQVSRFFEGDEINIVPTKKVRGKSILKQAQRNMKECFQHNKCSQIANSQLNRSKCSQVANKKYIKQKIQCIKNGPQGFLGGHTLKMNRSYHQF